MLGRKKGERIFCGKIVILSKFSSVFTGVERIVLFECPVKITQIVEAAFKGNDRYFQITLSQQSKGLFQTDLIQDCDDIFACNFFVKRTEMIWGQMDFFSQKINGKSVFIVLFKKI